MIFQALKRKCFQSDLTVLDKNGNYFITEVKYQERFEPPPFYGHGLPPYQVGARMDFYGKTGIMCLFLVFDKNDRDVFFQWLDVLENGTKFYTRNNRRVVFPIEAFNRLDF